MEVRGNLRGNSGDSSEAVHDAFVYLTEVSDVVVLLKPFRFVYKYFKIYVWVDLVHSD